MQPNRVPPPVGAERDGGPLEAAFTTGDPNGVGPEILLRALSELPGRSIRPVIFGDPEFLQNLAVALGLPLDLDWIRIVPVGSFPYPPQWGKICASAGEFAVCSLREAALYCRDGNATLLVTSPINKKAAHLAGFPHPGQTEHIASLFEGGEATMAFFSDRLNVLLATVHIPLREAPDRLSRGMLIRKTRLFHEALKRLGVKQPRIAFCGLNPHASEDGLFGDEEKRIVTPAVCELTNQFGEGIVQGPFSGDTIFRRALSGEFDGVVALYHDQGLIPVKLTAFESAVNATLGLPIVRTSPDHGTAFDIAGQGIADPRSMKAAIQVGERLAREQLRSCRP